MPLFYLNEKPDFENLSFEKRQLIVREGYIKRVLTIATNFRELKMLQSVGFSLHHLH
jgi:hypothetical protein